MAGKKRLDNGVDTYSVLLRLDRRMYEKLLKLKIVMGDGGSFNKWMNKVIGDVVHEHEGEISGYSVDVDNTDF